MKMNFSRSLILASAAILVGTSYVSSAKAADAKELYESKCAKCHGKSGSGDGRSGRALNTKPTDFTDAKTWEEKNGMAAEARMAKAIKSGGEAVKESKEMDSYPDFTDQQIKDLVTYLKTFKK